MKREFSAGGIVFKRVKNEKILKQVQDDILILVCQHSQHHGWVFPKGFIGDTIAGESKEDTALRETQEETGIIGTILEPITPITYWYTMDGEKHQKTVYYYLMNYVEGNTETHDFEMENVEWLPIENVAERLTYASDKTVWKEAKKRIELIVSN